MTHQNHQTNGASLEDCHTNFFALTELYGIKWRKLVWAESPGGSPGCGEGTPLADPVVSSYAHCLAGDILCVWRRVPAPPPPHDHYDITAPPPPPPQPPPLSLRAAKELWIFWYGEEPDLNGLVAPELLNSQGEQGSWESGLSYECRSLLFKALHNLIERCLLSRDFVRLGKWFVQPYDGDEDVGKSPWHLSFSFAFFLHGESTVCASVDVRQHPPVRTLTSRRLARVAQLAPPATPDHRHKDAKVILAPFGLEGSVTGREWNDTDPTTARLLDAWRQLYPLEQGCRAVEVVCGGVRMRYPSQYVVCAPLDSDEPPSTARPPAPAAPDHAPAAALAGRTMRALTQPAQSMEVCNGDHPDKPESDILDPTRKTSCTCAKWRRARRPRPVPFHRRARHDALSVGACSPGSCGGGSPAAPVSAPASAGPQPPSPAVHHHAAIPHVQSSCVPTALHTPAPTPDPLAPPTPASCVPAPPARQYPTSPQPPELPRRPQLPPPERKPDPLEDEHELHMLYDYTSVHAWLEHPVKRFKSADRSWSEEVSLGGADAGGDLYAGHHHTDMAAAPCLDHRAVGVKVEKTEDDNKEYKNLFTSDGLCPTLKDLDQIFDNSDDAASGDETVRLLVQTPPDSNKSTEELRCAGRVVRAEELSKMFPTPPSLEANAQPSPGFTLPDDVTSHSHHAPAQHKHLQGSPQPQQIDDWSYVFKPPTVCEDEGSSKYAPLQSLPSQHLPAVSLPSHAVYRPRWQQDQGSGVVTSSASINVNRRTPRALSAGSRTPARAPAGSPAGGPSPAPVVPPPPALPVAPPRRHPPEPPARSPAAPAPRACPLMLNVLLADTVLNVFRDHNFDSCTLCVCNAEPKVVGNIRGADAVTYLPHTTTGPRSPDGSPGGSPAPVPPDDDPVRCTCGFSAVLNRRLAHRAGLFYEDEMEITGVAEDPARHSGNSGRAAALAEVASAVLAQCVALGGAASALGRAARASSESRAGDESRINLLEYLDGGDAAALALRAACRGRAGSSPRVARWALVSANGPHSSRDVVALMRRLRPLLQDAIQKRCCGTRMWDGVSGPLTWRQFHRLAGRGNEDLCEPQPVPCVLVGHERDWVSLAPHALQCWERLALEPYSPARDTAYVVLAPDAPALHEPLRVFFRELSATYEACRLGRHAPLCRVAPEGLVRVAPLPASGPDEWLGELPPGRAGDCVRGYSERLRTKLVSQLASMTLDHALFETDSSRSHYANMDRSAPSPMRPPSTPDHPPTPNSQSDQENESPLNGGAAINACGPAGACGAGVPGDAEERGCPLLTVYVVDPGGQHAARSLVPLLRLAAKLQHALHHHHPLVKIISLDGVWSASGVGGGGWAGELRALAFSVFSGARRLLSHNANGKSLTGFGTAANASLFLKSKDEKNRAPYQLFTPPFVLAPPRALKDVSETWGQPSPAEQCGVLFLSYCLSHDQRFLLAAVTDARGELLDATSINVHVPARSRRRRQAPARRLGLTKLMDFTLGVMSQAAQPWRLVVGRVGRIGHGELKGWSWLLSRKNLTRASAQLREICGSCAVLYPSGVPCILSACLISTEPDSCLRLMADRFTPDERFSQASIASHLHTPRDVTATHILVFPTSATTQSNQMPFEAPMTNGETDDMMYLGVDLGEDVMGEDNMTDLLNADMLMWAASSPRRLDDDPTGSREGSPARQLTHDAPAYGHGGGDDTSEQVGTVLQQPLALGYLVSTAPVSDMPGWWWAGCAHLRDACPAFLKNALHLHAGALQTNDDLLTLTQHRHLHPLDSQTTTDVLRYVLEGYNALSWLSYENTRLDRASCLPIHMQVLMRLYHIDAAIHTANNNPTY